MKIPLLEDPTLLVDENGFLHRKLKHGATKALSPTGGTGFFGSRLGYYKGLGHRFLVEELKDRYWKAIEELTA